MQPSEHPRVARLLHRLAGGIYRYPRLFFYPQAVLLLVALLFTVRHLEFSTDRNDLVGSEKKYHQNYLRFKEEFQTQDNLVAVVESEDREKNRQFVERLGRRLAGETNLFQGVFYKGDLSMLGPKALFFLSRDELAELKETLREYRPFLGTFSEANSLNDLFRLVNRKFREAGEAEEGGDAAALLRALPSLSRVVEQAESAIHRRGVPPTPGLSALFGAGEEAEQASYITFAGGRIYLVIARALQPELNVAAVSRLRELVRETEEEVPGVNVGVTGESVLEIDEMRQSQTDSAKATGIALVLVALVFMYGYRQTGRPIKATLCLLVGLGYTLGYTTVTVGHLNILTVTFLPILVGLAIDFGIHLITRYEEELRDGASERVGLERAMVNTGMGIFTGCFTTAGAFFAMALTDFKGIQEMGIITGGGMLVCLIPMMTLLPALLLMGRQNVIDHQRGRGARRARIERLWLTRPKRVVLATLILTGLALTQFPKVYFDYNLLNMQSAELPAVVFQKKLIGSESKSVLFAAVVADDLEEALMLQKRIEALPTVATVDAMSPYIHGEDQELKAEEIAEIKELVEPIEFKLPDDQLVDPAELTRTIFYTRAYLNLAIEEVEQREEAEVLRELKHLRESLDELRYTLLVERPPGAVERLTEYQRGLFLDVAGTFGILKMQDEQGGIRPADLPEPLRERFIGRTGKYLLQVYPRANVWNREAQEEFVQELRTVDPEVTGTPVQLYEYTTLLKESYEEAAWYALGAIAVLVLLHFRSVVNVVLALLPVGLGIVWMTGLMGWLGVPFNPANIMTLPLVIGIGVTNGIHILNRFAEEQNPAILAKSTGKAVLVSGLTTIAGFGSLIQAEHQGISSLGVVMSMGVATCMIVALTFLPSLITILMGLGWRMKKKPSGDNAQSTLGREEPR